MTVYSPAWHSVSFPSSSYSRSYTSATNPSDASITQLSSVTVAKAEIFGSVVVTTILSVVSGDVTLVRMKVNGTEINAEGSTGTVTSVMTITPISTLTASVLEHLTATSGTDESIEVEVPWNSINTITCEGLDTTAASNMTLVSSRATAAVDSIYRPTWGDGA